MNSERFDNLSRKRALSRRQAVAIAAAGGVGTVLAHVRPSRVQGQELPVTCRYPIEMTPASSSSLFEGLSGMLTLPILEDGSIDQGTLELLDGRAFTVTGQANRRTFDLLALDSNGEGFSLSGTALTDISACDTTARGLFGGPLPGDTGTWQLSASTSPEATATALPVVTSTWTPTLPSAPCAGITCPPDFLLVEADCKCECRPGTLPCGLVCCVDGTVCLDEFSDLCGCPPGTELCGGVCVASCIEGTLNPATCLCEWTDPGSPCLPNDQACVAGADCCSGICDAGFCGLA